MSQWTDRIRDHQVWHQLKTLGPVIDQAIAREGNEPAAIDGLERLRSILTFAGKRLAAQDPFLLNVAPLDGLASSLESASLETQAFVSDGNAGHINNANSHADTALTYLAQLNSVSTAEDLTVISASVASYRATLQQYLKDAHESRQKFQVDVDNLHSKLSEVGAELGNERQKVSSLGSEFQSQFSAAQESRNREYAEAQGARQEKYANLLNDYTHKLAEQNAEFENQRKVATTNYLGELAHLRDQYGEGAAKVLAEINDHKTQVEKLVGVIGNLGVTSGYLKTANYARRTVWLWQTITVVALAGVIIVAYEAFAPLVQGKFTWEGFAARVFLSVTVGVLAAYSASQADKFLEIERRNRKMALELEALGPYLAPLPKEMQDQFRREIGDRSFGHQDTRLVVRSEKSPATLIDALGKSKDIREFLIELVKAVRKD